MMNAEKFNRLFKKIHVSERAYSALYEYYFPRIVIDLTIRFGDKFFAEDIAQEFFENRIFKIELKEDVAYPMSWLSKICVRMALTAKGRERAVLPFSAWGEEAFATTDERGIDEDVLLTRNETEEDYFKKLLLSGVSEETVEVFRKMGKANAELLVLHYFEGYSLSEIAIKNKMNYATLRVKIKRAKKFFEK